MIIGGLHCAMCVGVWWFINLCAHIILYFDLIVIIDGQIAIMDFGIDYYLGFTTGELASDGSIFKIYNIFQ
jgi:hypothetical protein